MEEPGINQVYLTAALILLTVALLPDIQTQGALAKPASCQEWHLSAVPTLGARIGYHGKSEYLPNHHMPEKAMKTLRGRGRASSPALTPVVFSTFHSVHQHWMGALTQGL